MLQRVARTSGSRTRVSAIAAGFALLLGAFVFSTAYRTLASRSAAATETGQGKMINVFVTVRDKKGKIVSDLTSNDFTLTEDGRPQSLQHFSKAASQPLTVGLLVDTSSDLNRELDRERSASGGFFDQMIREDMDKAFVIHFDNEVELLQDLTNSHQKLEQALVALQSPQFSQSQTSDSQDPDSSQGRSDRGLGMRSHGGAQLYDAIYLASNELMKKPSGRKTIVLLSDGVDRRSKESLDSALEAAQRSNTMIYTVMLKGEEENQAGGRGGFGYPGIGGPGMGRHGGGGRGGSPQQNRPDGRKTLERISSETGGRFFEASKKLQLDQIYGEIEEDLRSQYDLGYTPVRAEGAETGFHRIQLTTTKKDDLVQVQAGYYSDFGR